EPQTHADGRNARRRCHHRPGVPDAAMAGEDVSVGGGRTAPVSRTGERRLLKHLTPTRPPNSGLLDFGKWFGKLSVKIGISRLRWRDRDGWPGARPRRSPSRQTRRKDAAWSARGQESWSRSSP